MKPNWLHPDPNGHAWRVPDSAETPLTSTLCQAPSPYPYNIYLPIRLKFLPCGFTALIFPKSEHTVQPTRFGGSMTPSQASKTGEWKDGRAGKKL